MILMIFSNLYEAKTYRFLAIYMKQRRIAANYRTKNSELAVQQDRTTSSQLSTILNNIVEAELGVTTLNNIVDNVGVATLFNPVFNKLQQVDEF